ncbi:MAG: signal peptidase I [Deltaproteobacteria bacterium]|nr:signal peptidase I [Deltaproteobacteria bacterium]
MGVSPRWARVKSLAKGLGILLAVTVLVGLIPVRQVRGDDMLWSIQPGDFIWIVPDRVRKADVVLVTNPLDSDRKVLRRVVAGPGDRVRVDDSSVRVNGKRIRQTEMGDRPGHRIRKEVIWSRPPARANPYFTQLVIPEVPWSTPGVVEVPEGHWYLLADRRDRGVDSRWWGPVSESVIEGVVRMQAGPTNTWRESPIQLVLPEE